MTTCGTFGATQKSTPAFTAGQNQIFKENFLKLNTLLLERVA